MHLLKQVLGFLGNSLNSRLGYALTLNGKRKKYTSKAYKTKNEALAAEREFSLQIGNVSEDKNMTFKELYTAYYNYQEDKVKPTTLKTYRDRIKYMQLLDNIKLKDLSIKHYELWRKEINKADISTAYKNDIQKFIKIVLNWGSKMYDFDFRSFYNKITKFINHNELKKRNGLLHIGRIQTIYQL